MINVKAQREIDKKKENDNAINTAQLYKDLFNSPTGQKVLKDLDKYTGINEDSFNESPHRSASEQGRQSIGIHIRTKLLESK